MPLNISPTKQKSISNDSLFQFNQFLSHIIVLTQLKKAKQFKEFRETINVIDRQINIKRQKVGPEDEIQSLMIQYIYPTNNQDYKNEPLNLKLITLSVPDSKHNVEILYNRLKHLADYAKIVLKIMPGEQTPKTPKMNLTLFTLPVITELLDRLYEKATESSIAPLITELIGLQIPENPSQIDMSANLLKEMPLLQKFLNDTPGYWHTNDNISSYVSNLSLAYISAFIKNFIF